MSEVPQHADPDLHAIFGIDAEADGSSEPVISVERAGPVDGGPDREPDIEVERGLEMGPAIAEEPLEDSYREPEGSPAEAVDPDSMGITRPSRRGSSQRFLTDVIVAMGLASRRQVDEAVESSRNLGTTPERVLVDNGSLTQDALARALAERYGLDHLDLGVFSDDIAALVSRLDRLEDVVGEASELVVEEDGGEVVALHETSDDAPVIKLVNQLVGQAVERGASDLHLAPDGRDMRV